MIDYFIRLKFDKLIENILAFGEIDNKSWPEYKALHIEALLLACQVNSNRSLNQAYALALQYVREHRETYINSGMPDEYYADLFFSLKELAKT